MPQNGVRKLQQQIFQKKPIELWNPFRFECSFRWIFICYFLIASRIFSQKQ